MTRTVAVVLLLMAPAGLAFANEPQPAEVHWTAERLTIDGRANEPQWDTAPVIDRFTLPWLGDDERPAKTATRARLLWDDDYLYFFAAMEDRDLFADVTEHDGDTWTNDVFELFFKPSTGRPEYYEFEINAAGAVLDMLVRERDRNLADVVAESLGRDEFHVEAKVVTRGTLDNTDDRDSGWSVEGRIPWSDFSVTGGRPEAGDDWRFALCRYDYSADGAAHELSTSAPLGVASFHDVEDYAPLVFVGADSSPGERPFGIAERTPFTTSRVVGSPDPPLPYRVVRTLPDLQLDYPVFVVREPGSRRLMVIHSDTPYGTTWVRRTTDDPASGETELLLETSEVLYSICFHPDFAHNGYLYIGGNGARDGGPKQTRVSRYTMSREPPYALDPDSELVIIECDSDGHNGAAVAFGLDGMLYVTTGDGTSDSDDDVVGQRMDLLLAKTLRIDVDHPDEGCAYSVPPDNPFVDLEGARPETWAYGFRNPWRMTVDPRTGTLWVAQNGQDLWEQAYAVQRGANYGWSVYEGSHPFYLNRELGPTPHVLPTFEHPHSEARSLTGGVVYYGERFPDLQGAYIYGDYSTGKIWAGKLDEQGHVAWHREIADSTLQITSFALDADGELLISDHQGDGKGGLYTLEVNDTPFDPDEFPRTLSESGLFASVAGHETAAGVVPYSVNSPLWSDGAFKARYFAIPESAVAESDAPPITFHRENAWAFPDGTVLVKSFGLEMTEHDPGSRRWIETRFLTRQQGEWVGYSYAWNDEQTEGTLVDSTGRDQVFKIRTADGIREQTWHFPSRTECMVCHSRAANYVLGPSTPQMNRNHDYGGIVDNQLRVLEHLGYIKTGLHPDEAERLPDPSDQSELVESRARAYLHANCAHCHVPAGGGNAQMDLLYSSSDEKLNVFDVPPLHHTFGIEDARLIAPGAPNRSVLLHRIATTDPGRMPQLATSIPDEMAVKLLTEWIAGMSESEAAASD